MKFSDRIGKTTPKIAIQTEDIDADLRNLLWNAFDSVVLTPVRNESTSYFTSSNFRPFFEKIWVSYFKFTYDTMSSSKANTIKQIRDYFFNTSWFNVYNFIEFILKNLENEFAKSLFKEICNSALKQELSGYRIIENELVTITDENQIAQIENAIESSSLTSLISVNIHLKTALQILSDKKSPDFRNSMKESISAVESLAQIISGDNKADLGKALKIIKTKVGLHSALEQGFIKIYGYTSDGDGIRHSLTEEPTVDTEDAIFMLTSCSAFINYLIIKADKAGIKFN